MTGSHRRILVVEDDPETAGQLVESLTTSGYKVDLATSGNGFPNTTPGVSISLQSLAAHPASPIGAKPSSPIVTLLVISIVIRFARKLWQPKTD